MISNPFIELALHSLFINQPEINRFPSYNQEPLHTAPNTHSSSVDTPPQSQNASMTTDSLSSRSYSPTFSGQWVRAQLSCGSRLTPFPLDSALVGAGLVGLLSGNRMDASRVGVLLRDSAEARRRGIGFGWGSSSCWAYFVLSGICVGWVVEDMI
jgi:hypothetical protein